MLYLTGPEVRNLVAAMMNRRGIHGAAKYAYANPKPGFARAPVVGGTRRAPEYEADFLLMTAFAVNMGAPLEPMESLLRELSGCIDVRLVREHATLRPQVQALYRRADLRHPDEVPRPVVDLHVRCAYPMRPDAIAASDRCGAPATSAVLDDKGNRWYRCPEHRGQLDHWRSGEVVTTLDKPPSA